MKLGVLMTALLVTSGAAFAAEANQTTAVGAAGTVFKPPLQVLCATGFKYSVKEQFGNPNTGHLWYICAADVLCRGTIAVGTTGVGQPVWFDYSCVVPAIAPLPCAPGFGPSTLPGGQPSCKTPVTTCPAGFQMMTHTATRAADLHSAHFEYQCYRPG